MKVRRCEGMRRFGGAFTLGPVRWEQCTNDPTVLLRIQQDGKTRNFPACQTCWKEALATKAIKVLSAKPIA